MQLLDRYDLFIFDWDNTLSSSTAPIRAMQFVKKDVLLWYAKDAQREIQEGAHPKMDDMLNKEDEHSFYAAALRHLLALLQARPQEGRARCS